MKHVLVLVSVAMGISLVGCTSKTVTPTSTSTGIPVPPSVLGTQGNLYTISVFAKAPGPYQEGENRSTRFGQGFDAFSR